MKGKIIMLLFTLVSCSSKEDNSSINYQDEKSYDLNEIQALKDSIKVLNTIIEENQFTPYLTFHSDTISSNSELLIPAGLYERSNVENIKVVYWIDDSSKLSKGNYFWMDFSAYFINTNIDFEPKAFTQGEHKIYGERVYEINGQQKIEPWVMNYYVEQ